MANQLKADAAEKLIACARSEFLEKGYESASLRAIAAKAGVSTYLIYERFADKAGLLDAVVRPARERLIEAYDQEMRRFNEFSPDAPYGEMVDYSTDNCRRIIDVLYDDFDTFRLIVVNPVETRLEDLLHALVEIHTRQVHIYFDALGSDVLTRVSPDLLHIVTTALFSGLLEVVRHGMDRDTALTYYRQLLQYYMTGFQAFLE